MMQTERNDIPGVWQSLTAPQRKFLLVAYEIDLRLPHSDGLDKVMPPIAWRTVGLMSGVRLNEVDELVRTLSDLRLVLVLDASMREMALISRHQMRELVEAHRRRRWNWATVAVALLAVLGTLLWLSHS
jgi:hypothetical protein